MQTDRLLGTDGQPRFGVYDGSITDLSLGNYARVTHPLKHLRAKRWRFVGLFHPEVVAGVAVVDTGYMGTTFAYAFDLTTRKIIEYRDMSLLGRHAILEDNLQHGMMRFDKGGNRVQNRYVLGEAPGELDVLAATKGGILEIRATIDENPAVTLPHQMVGPTPGGRFVFTHKSAGLPASGHIIMGDRRFKLDEGECFGAVDHTAGYHDYHWEWRWASFGGTSEDGRRIGLNLVDPIHHDTWQENALWVDGKRIPVGRARFDYDRSRILDPWQVRSDDGQVNLSFTPLGERTETINAGLIKSAFHQPVGLYSGELNVGGELVRLRDVPGVVEDHEARW